MRRWWILLTALHLASQVASAADRYSALFADGTRAEAPEVLDWNEPDASARIGDKPLFSTESPFRWLLDRQTPIPPVPVSYLEFDNGDRLAGEVTGYSTGRENTYESSFPYLLVKPAAEVQPPDVTNPALLRVTTDWLRRIVWTPVAPQSPQSSQTLQPGTVWLRTGHSHSFRSLRWAPQGVTLLTAEGIKEFQLADLAELHLPERDPWNSYYEQLAVLSPQLKSRLLQLRTGDGSIWTTSTERFQARHHGDRNRPEQWLQLIQPAWSLDSIWLRYRTICQWRSFAPEEVPLSMTLPVNISHQAVFGRIWDYQHDQNVLHGPLQSRHQEFGWGFGVHGSSSLTFRYPESARAFRTLFGLDRSVQEGGCVNAEILFGQQQPIIRRDGLVGSTNVEELPWTELPVGDDDEKLLTLRTEMAHEDRPSGADPFDIRDVFNWYEPELKLDAAMLREEVSRRATGRMAGLIGWTISPVDLRSMVISNTTNSLDPRDPHFRITARSTDSFYTMSRKVKVGKSDRWLVLNGSRFLETSSPSAVQIRIEGRVYGEFDVPSRQSITDPEPMLIPIEGFQGSTIAVDVVVYPSDERSWIDWRGFALTQHPPGVLPLFEDHEDLSRQLTQGEGSVEVDPDQPFSGTHSLKVFPPSVGKPAVPGLEAAIFEHPQLGQYRYLLFAWKQQTGTRIQLQLANHGEFRDQGLHPIREPHSFDVARRRTLVPDERGQRFAYSYEAGAVTTSVRHPLWLHGDLPRNWQTIQRDLFGDFGTLLLTGIALKATDGDACWFDSLYLARTQSDIEYISQQRRHQQSTRPPDALNDDVPIPAADFATEFSRVAPLFSSPEMPQGLGRLAEFRGQPQVVQTQPNGLDKPLTFRAGVHLPAERPMELDLVVTNSPESEWRLIVRANGETIHDRLINDELTSQEGWVRLQVDLARYAGQKVLLEVRDQSGQTPNATAYWKQIALTDKQPEEK